MPNFVAKEKDPASVLPDAPGTVAEIANFSFTDEGSDSISRSFRYATRKHEFRDVLRLGYFDAIAKEFTIRVWDEIHVTAGADPTEATRAILRVIRVPSTGRRRLTERLADPHGGQPEEHLRLAIIARWKPSPVLHDGADKSPATPKRKAA